jgi:O-antigen biosynthesis protein
MIGSIGADTGVDSADGDSDTLATEAGVSVADIESCFRLFLISPPPADLYSAWLGRPVSDLVRDLFSVEDFKTKVLTAVLLREPLPLQSAPATPPWSLLDWAQQRLPLRPDTRRALGLARSWELALELLLADPAINALSPDMITAGIDAIMADRVKDEPTLQVTRSLVGAVDSATAWQVRGWAVDLCDKPTRLRLDIMADNVFLGTALCNEPRADVSDHVGGDGNYGFTFIIPSAHRLVFTNGRTVRAIDRTSGQQIGGSVLVNADSAQDWDTLEATRREIVALRKSLERIERSLPDLSRMASVPLEAYDAYWERFYRLSPDEAEAQRRASAQFDYRPLVSVVLPTWNSDTRLLEAAIDSVLAQTYDRWELIIADDGSSVGDELTRLRRRHAEADSRIRLVEATEQEGIAVNTNRAIVACRGDYVAFLDHDDELAPDALFHVVSALQHRRYGLVYSDEDRIELGEYGRNVHLTPFFKPAFDPDLLTSINYICHLTVIRHDALVEAGPLRPGFEGAQDHEFLLRVTERLSAADIRHIPRILYHWRIVSSSVSQTASRTDAINAAIVRAVSEHFDRLGADVEVSVHADAIGSNRGFAARARWRLPTPAPSVSIIIPTRDRLDLLRPCIDSLRASEAAYPGTIELLIVDNDSQETGTLDYLAKVGAEAGIRVLSFSGKFNWSAINNFAASEASGDVLVFLNNDTVVLSQDWCAELVAHAARPEVGAVGPRLLYEDGTIQHGGVVLGVMGVAGHDAVGDTPADGGYFGRTHLLRGASAVTGACLATRRSLFLELGGFDELALKIAFNDTDYCLKLAREGYRIIYNPFAVLFHYESKSRGRDVTDAQMARHQAEVTIMRDRWGDAIDHDPLYNAHFERYARPFTRLRPPPKSNGPSNGGSV